MTMQTKSQRTQKQMDLSIADARRLVLRGDFDLTGAGLYQVLGPHWHDIIWVTNPLGRKPYISHSHTHAQISAMLAEVVA